MFLSCESRFWPTSLSVTPEELGIANMGPETTEAEKACLAARSALKVQPV